MTSEVTLRARAFVEDRLPEAQGLGAALAELIEDPESFTRALTDGLERLADEAYAAEQERVAPGSGATIGVRWPLTHAVERALRRPLRESSSSSAVWLAQRLARAETREVRLFSLPCLERALPDDPERCWQLMRQLARGARDWISVDSLAGTWARGIALEPFRWAELEQLVYSALRMERRLVGSTLASLAHVARGDRSLDATAAAGRALELVSTLMGDADDHVQKSLGWALREWTRVDAPAVERLLREETETAAANGDGHRAWVIRDTLSHVDPALAATLRGRLAGIRRRGEAPSTSRAGAIASAFAEPIAMSDVALGQQGERYARRSA